MNRSDRSRRAGVLGLAGWVFACLVIAVGSATAVAAEEEFEGASAAFKLKGTNGYSLVLLAASKRPDGRGAASLLVSKNHAGAIYTTTRATITPTRLEADFGDLGELAVDAVPTGRTRTVESRCGGDPFSYEQFVYRGTIEFHGEEGFTDVSATSVPDDIPFFAGLICPGLSVSDLSGQGLPGAKLRLWSRDSQQSLSLEVKKNRRTAVTSLEAGIFERRDGLRVSRSVGLIAPAGAFRFDPSLRTATVEPPAPFAGHASYRRDSAPTWTGNLTVDFPGRSGVRLAGSGLRPKLVHAQWSKHRFSPDDPG